MNEAAEEFIKSIVDTIKDIRAQIAHIQCDMRAIEDKIMMMESSIKLEDSNSLNNRKEILEFLRENPDEFMLKSSGYTDDELDDIVQNMVNNKDVMEDINE